ncbi:MAG: DUF2955 domain-containing protein [Acidiferrobacterales bacterium]
MSTDIPAARPVDLSPRKTLWTHSLRTARIVRYAVGVTTAAALAFGFNWPLFFVTPLFTAVFLAMPLPAPTIKEGFQTMLYPLVAFSLGLLFTLFVLHYPLIYVPALGLVLFHIYYLANRGGPFVLVVMCLLAVLLLPLMSTQHPALAVVFALYFAGSAVLAIILVLLAHGLFPDPPSERPAPAPAGFQPGYSSEAALAALKSTIAILPLATLFIAFSLTSQLLIMVYAAIFSLLPELSEGRAFGLKMLKSTLIGGLAAVVFFSLIVAVPEFHFFVALMFFTTLLFGAGIFSEHPLAKYLSSAVTALLILLGTSMGEGASLTDKYIVRVVLISGAALYVVSALSVFDHLWPRRSREA